MLFPVVKQSTENLLFALCNFEGFYIAKYCSPYYVHPWRKSELRAYMAGLLRSQRKRRGSLALRALLIAWEPATQWRVWFDS